MKRFENRSSHLACVHETFHTKKKKTSLKVLSSQSHRSSFTSHRRRPSSTRTSTRAVGRAHVSQLVRDAVFPWSSDSGVSAAATLPSGGGHVHREPDQGGVAKVRRRRLPPHGEQQLRAGAATLHGRRRSERQLCGRAAVRMCSCAVGGRGGVRVYGEHENAPHFFFQLLRLVLLAPLVVVVLVVRVSYSCRRRGCLT